MLPILACSDQEKFWLQTTNVPCCICSNFNEWVQYSQPKAAVYEILHVNKDSVDRLEQIYLHSDLTIVILPEMVTDSLLRKFDRERRVFFTGAVLNYQLAKAAVEFMPFFFWSTTDFYHANSEYLKQLRPGNESKVFDALLGRRKKHRTLLYNELDLDCNIVTYFSSDQDQDITCLSQQEFIWPDVLVKPKHAIIQTVDEVIVNQTIVSLSQLVPCDIYNQCHYSIVAETHCENNWSFYTEKIVKPILAQRLFLVVAGKHYLKNLKQLGFKTFDSIIDESYDNQDVLEVRIKMIVDQIHRLTQADHAQVKAQILSVVQHNYKHLLGTCWQTQMIDQLSAYLTAFYTKYTNKGTRYV